MIGFALSENRNVLRLALENKNIVIIDDVITTGASMKRGVELLKTTCNGQVIISSIARTVK